ncbi:hypothetical protein DI09_191p10 [Mitosporidium daphniae]|uniref:Rab GDP dissociation inhibitor n=1 Tax=Mitosporidium daphniae TaxID=1485682 RepID=A0A098VS93_9MICR|nr:uncharacterized protein DI09_61p30 [Mitosporidium daphniae]XP_013238724.1 uncharacterized protein DI09_191p10 [Mitosporidium daphniae]KGG50616.1 hypothetical protein DI09_61p30 [Mitosporidium daphniae]KGG52288.1 hypothetical protein DI09_191p10 [Mitosporidium daphniae]|eukprot:XP_013237061.1 uncharacterized protein DI09_61p30 [Mitosporidium daphniae]
MAALYEKYGLARSAQDFIGHALALQSDDSYLTREALPTCNAIALYMNSVTRFGKSPFIYPLFGLGDLSQAFARLGAVHGGTYMLNVGDVVLLEQANEHGQVISGVRTVPVEVHSNGAGKEASNSHPAANLSSPIGTFQCRRGVIGDPSYFPSFVETKSKIIRAVCILPGPVPHTGGIDSLQIIIPQRELLRLSDMYITVLSHAHGVAPSPFFLAYISTLQEQEHLDPIDEISSALALLGPVLECFVFISNYCVPAKNSSCPQNLFISRSYDSSSHFESVCADVKELYHQITGRHIETILQKDQVDVNK